MGRSQGFFNFYIILRPLNSLTLQSPSERSIASKSDFHLLFFYLFHFDTTNSFCFFIYYYITVNYDVPAKAINGHIFFAHIVDFFCVCPASCFYFVVIIVSFWLIHHCSAVPYQHKYLRYFAIGLSEEREKNKTTAAI